MNINDIKNIIDNTVNKEVKKTILESSNKSKKDYYHVIMDNKPIETFENEKDAQDYVDTIKDKKTGKNLIIDKKSYKSYGDMIDNLDKLNDNIKENKMKSGKKRNVYEDYSMDEYDTSNEMMDDSSKFSDEDFLSTVDDYKSAKQSMDEEPGFDDYDDDDDYTDTSFEDDYIRQHADYTPSQEDIDFVDSLRRNANREIENGMEDESEPYTSDIYEDDDDDDDDDDISYENEYRRDKDYTPTPAENKFMDYLRNKGDKNIEDISPENDIEEHDDPYFSDDDDVFPDTSFEDDYISQSDEYTPTSDEEREIEFERKRKNREIDRADDFTRSSKSDSSFDKMDELDEYFDMDETFDMEEGNYGQCDECGGMLNESGVCKECGGGRMEEYGGINENKKRKLVLRESELISLIRNIIKESVPGLQVTKKAQSASKTENSKYIKEVGSKMKKRESFSGNDNPEFPHQIGSKTKKMARRNTSQQDEEVAKNKAGLQNLKYDREPSKNFKKRMKMSIEGHSTMGNAPFTKPVKQKATNVIKTDTPKKINKQVQDREKDKKDRVIYKKENVPVKTSKSINESKLTNTNLLNEINKIKKLTNYNEKTQ